MNTPCSTAIAWSSCELSASRSISTCRAAPLHDGPHKPTCGGYWRPVLTDRQQFFLEPPPIINQLLRTFKCDLTLFQELHSPITSFPTTPRNAGSSPNCKDNIPWFSSSAAEVTAPRTVGRRKGLFNSTASLRLPTAGLSQLALTTSRGRTNIAPGSAPTGLSSPTRGASFRKI